MWFMGLNYVLNLPNKNIEYFKVGWCILPDVNMTTTRGADRKAKSNPGIHGCMVVMVCFRRRTLVEGVWSSALQILQTGFD
jgi:hypothetical protein